jgi:hypothetical protein
VVFQRVGTRFAKRMVTSTKARLQAIPMEIPLYVGE